MIVSSLSSDNNDHPSRGAAAAASTTGRRLFGAPVLLQDWDRAAEEGAAQYWELFLDLLLVAGASALADQLKEDERVGHFALYYLVVVNGWNLYTHHITTRFEDASLAHAMLLLVYFYGFGLEIVNVGDPAPFAVGALLQRGTILVMLGTIAHGLPRARVFCLTLGSMVSLTMAALVVTLRLGGNAPVQMAGLWTAAVLELLAEFVLALVLSGPRLIPINIEQSKERLGALVLIMLGETALSVTITYRELDREEIVGDTKNRYYWVLGLSFLLIFMFCVFYFHMQPPPADHAFRRSRWHGTTCFVLHKFLGLALLAVGTSVKLVVEAVLLEKETASRFTYHLLGFGVGTALLLLYILRYLHHGGRREIHFGKHTLVFGEHADLDRIASIWWYTVACAWPLPFIGSATGWTMRDPLTSLAQHALLLFVLCVMESIYSHTITRALETRDLRRGGGEGQPLLADDTKRAYDFTN